MVTVAVILKRLLCRHEFALSDLERTAVEPPTRPSAQADYLDWSKYYDELWHGKWRRHCVRWPCYKCGKVFEAYCGLDISPRHGRITR